MNKEIFYEKVSAIQTELKAPKSQRNDFGNYNYRNCEDILEAVKPLLMGLVLTISDDIVMMGDRFYVKATVTITDGENSISNSAFARESLTRKGMDDAQLTGATSSYARKYAMNGLFLIDDTRDADSMDNTNVNQGKSSSKQSQSKPQDNNKPWYNKPDFENEREVITNAIRNGTPPTEVINKIQQTFKVSKEMQATINSI